MVCPLFTLMSTCSEKLVRVLCFFPRLARTRDCSSCTGARARARARATSDIARCNMCIRETLNDITNDGSDESPALRHFAGEEPGAAPTLCRAIPFR